MNEIKVLRIRELRKTRGCTRAQIAKELGVTASAVGQWETGARHPRIEMLPRLAEVFGCAIGDLFVHRGEE